MMQKELPVATETYMESFLRQLAWQKQPLLTAASLLLAVVAGLLAAQQPLLAIVTIALALFIPLIVIQSEIATLLVVFLFYTNIVVVAVRFHDVPYTIAGAFPLLLLAPLATQLIFRREQPILYRTLPWLLFFIFVQLLGALMARNVRIATNNFIIFLTEGLMLYLVLINVVRTPDTLSRVTWTLLLAGVFLSAFPLYQQLTGTFDNIYWGFGQLSETGFRTGEETLLGEVRQFRAAGAVGEQNRFAQVMLMLVPLGLYTFLTKRTTLSRFCALGATIFAFLGVAVTFSRGAAVALVLLLASMVLLRIIRAYQFVLILIGIGLVLLAFPEYRVRLGTISQAIAQFSEGTTSQTDSSIQGRTTEMLAAALVFVDHPLIGVGPGMFKYYAQEYGNRLGIHYLEGTREAHSLYLDIAANHGVIGFIAFFAIFYLTMRDLIKVRKRLKGISPQLHALATGYLLALMAYLTTGIFLHLSYVRYLWLMLALAAATVTIAERVLDGDEVLPERTTMALPSNARNSGGRD